MEVSLNIIDIGILGIILVSAFIGVYQGFIVASGSIVSYAVSWAGAIFYGPKLASTILSKTSWYNMILYFSDGASKVQEVANRELRVSALSSEKAALLVSEANLPIPFDRLVSDNLINKSLTGVATTVGEYFNVSMANIVMNVLCFIAAFLIIRVIFIVIISCIKSIIDIPMLKHFDSLSGAALGIIRGFLVVFVLFSLIPVALMLIPIPQEVLVMLDNSAYADIFIKGNIITHFITGVIN